MSRTSLSFPSPPAAAFDRHRPASSPPRRRWVVLHAALAAWGWLGAIGAGSGLAATLERLPELSARVSDVVPLPTDGVRGIAVSGRTLWLLATDNRSLAAPESSFVSRIVRVDLDVGAVDTLAIEVDAYESGLAWDGSWLWSAGSLLREHAGVYRIDPTSGDISLTLACPGYHPGGLAAAGGYLWQVDCDARKLYRLDPAEGRVSRKLPSPAFYPTGLAHDGSRFWCADASTGRLYRMRGFNADPEGVVSRGAFDRPGEFVSLAWDAGALWAVSASDSTATRIEIDR